MSALPGWVLAVSSGVGLVAGGLIGCVGVGGVILVPSLIQLPGVDIKRAVGACMFSYVFMGLAGLVMYWRQESVEARGAAWFSAGAAPAALFASWILRQADGFALQVVCYALVMLSATLSLCRERQARRREREEEAAGKGDGGGAPDAVVVGAEVVTVAVATPAALVAEDDDDDAAAAAAAAAAGGESAPPPSCMEYEGRLFCLYAGAVCGFGSALTGTSGPVILLPILIYHRWPTLASLGHAQAVQLPIAAMATIGNVFFSESGEGEGGRADAVDWKMGGCIAATGVVGVVGGALLAHRLPVASLRRFITRLLCVAGVALLLKVIITKLVG